MWPRVVDDCNKGKIIIVVAGVQLLASVGASHDKVFLLLKMIEKTIAIRILILEQYR